VMLERQRQELATMMHLAETDLQRRMAEQGKMVAKIQILKGQRDGLFRSLLKLEALTKGRGNSALATQIRDILFRVSPDIRPVWEAAAPESAVPCVDDRMPPNRQPISPIPPIRHTVGTPERPSPISPIRTSPETPEKPSPARSEAITPRLQRKAPRGFGFQNNGTPVKTPQAPGSSHSPKSSRSPKSTSSHLPPTKDQEDRRIPMLETNDLPDKKTLPGEETVRKPKQLNPMGPAEDFTMEQEDVVDIESLRRTIFKAEAQSKALVSEDTLECAANPVVQRAIKENTNGRVASSVEWSGCANVLAGGNASISKDEKLSIAVTSDALVCFRRSLDSGELEVCIRIPYDIIACISVTSEAEGQVALHLLENAFGCAADYNDLVLELEEPRTESFYTSMKKAHGEASGPHSPELNILYHAIPSLLSMVRSSHDSSSSLPQPKTDGKAGTAEHGIPSSKGASPKSLGQTISPQQRYSPAEGGRRNRRSPKGRTKKSKSPKRRSAATRKSKSPQTKSAATASRHSKRPTVILPRTVQRILDHSPGAKAKTSPIAFDNTSRDNVSLLSKSFPKGSKFPSSAPPAPPAATAVAPTSVKQAELGSVAWEEATMPVGGDDQCGEISHSQGDTKRLEVRPIKGKEGKMGEESDPKEAGVESNHVGARVLGETIRKPTVSHCGSANESTPAEEPEYTDGLVAVHGQNPPEHASALLLKNESGQQETVGQSNKDPSLAATKKLGSCLMQSVDPNGRRKNELKEVPPLPSTACGPESVQSSSLAETINISNSLPKRRELNQEFPDQIDKNSSDNSAPVQPKITSFDVTKRNATSGNSENAPIPNASTNHVSITALDETIKLMSIPSKGDDNIAAPIRHESKVDTASSNTPKTRQLEESTPVNSKNKLDDGEKLGNIVAEISLIQATGRKEKDGDNERVRDLTAVSGRSSDSMAQLDSMDADKIQALDSMFECEL